MPSLEQAVAQSAPALTVRSLTKWFGSQCALSEVDLEVRAGEIHALVGPNGSGKSTVVKVLGGYHRGDGGEASAGGRPFALGDPAEADAAGMRFVHQDLGLVEDLSVTDNFHLTAAEGAWVRPFSKRAEAQIAGEALRDFGYDIDPTRLVRDLTAAERTAVAIVRAVCAYAEDPKLLILDEPTASLPQADAEIMYRSLRSLVAKGRSVLFISHHLDEVLSLADRVTVLRDGRNVATRPTADLDSAALASLMLGRALAAEEAAVQEFDAMREWHGDPVLVVDGLAAEAARGVSFSVHSGEIVGVAGLRGSGREDVAPALSGQIDRDGEMSIGSDAVRGGNPRAAHRAGLQYLPAERRRDGLLGTATIRENIIISDLDSVSRLKRVVRRRERIETEKWIERLDVRPAEVEKPVSELSGGNQQKVVLGRLLRMHPRVLVLDEPTQGVDIGAKLAIHQLIREAAADGAAVVVCSSDENELSAVTSRILVMRKGRIDSVLEGAQITTERIEEELLKVSSNGPAQRVDENKGLVDSE